MTDVTAIASGGDAAFGVANSGSSFPTMTDVTATADGSPSPLFALGARVLFTFLDIGLQEDLPSRLLVNKIAGAYL